jgi:hypothetical protein
MRNPFHRKPPPRRALPAPPRSPDRRPRHGQDFSTTIGLIVVLVLTSAFVAGTTATFTASTRNTGKFTIAGLGKPTTPTASMGGTTATFGYTAASAGADYNVGIGYRIMRKSVGGPTTTAGSSSAPDCTAGTYAVLSPGYTQSSSYADPSIPSAAADQGEYFCYAAEGVWPCCPVTGNNPIITSKGGKIQIALQTGYVVSSWSFNSGNNNQQLASGEKLIVNFNQPVNTATSITASDSVCVDPIDELIRIGMSSSAVDSCLNTTNEVQRLTFSAQPSGNFTLTYNGSTTANIAGGSSIAAAIESALEALTSVGTGGVNVTRTSSTVYDVAFTGNNFGDVAVMTKTNPTGGQTLTISTPTAGVAQETPETQRLTFSAQPSGTFTLTYNGATTATIAGGATITSGIQTALEALTTVGTGGVLVTRTSNIIYDVRFTGRNIGDVPVMTKTNPSGGQTLTISTPTAGTAALASIAYLTNSGTWTGPAARFDISAVAWTNSNKTATITLGANLGTNTPTIPTGTYTIIPTPASGKSTSTTSALAICSTDPAGAPTGGLCRPTATGGW